MAQAAPAAVVTGATGFVASELVKAAAGEGLHGPRDGQVSP